MSKLKKQYITPEMQVVLLEEHDIVTASKIDEPIVDGDSEGI